MAVADKSRATLGGVKERALFILRFFTTPFVQLVLAQDEPNRPRKRSVVLGPSRGDSSKVTLFFKSNKRDMTFTLGRAGRRSCGTNLRRLYHKNGTFPLPAN